MKSSLILARDKNGVIGLDNGIPWRNHHDLALFKRLTMGKIVVMGRKTWDSLPVSVRPLPGRFNIVITSDVSSVKGEPQAIVNNIRAALEIADVKSLFNDQYSEIVFVGGSSIYSQVIDLVDEVHVSEFDHEVKPKHGSTTVSFPYNFNESKEWRLEYYGVHDQILPYFTHYHWVRNRPLKVQDI